MYASDLKHPQARLEEKLHRLYALNRNKAIDLSFRPPYLKLLEAFGNPHMNLPPVIHVAGTNGKGSIIAMLRSILEAAGYKVHAYTSPHLIKFNERIILAGEPIKDEPLEDLIDEALALNNGRDVTFFEITTAMMFAAFSRTPADICLLEVGLGGRLDCTNVIEGPLLTVINNISVDHQEYLGEPLSEIAAEKAGVIKAQVPCVLGVQSKDAIDQGVINVFEQKAKEKNAALFAHDADWSITSDKTQICFTFDQEETRYPHPNLLGTHQIENLGSALTALHLIKDKFPVSASAIEEGLRNINWRARLQKLAPSAFNLPEGWEIWLDGGHNQSAGEALATQAKHWRTKDDRPVYLIAAMMAHKDPLEFFTPLLDEIEALCLIPIPGEPKGIAPETLSNILYNKKLEYEIPLTICADLREALNNITEHHPPGRILIAGSLYLAGHVLHAYENAA